MAASNAPRVSPPGRIPARKPWAPSGQGTVLRPRGACCSPGVPGRRSTSPATTPIARRSASPSCRPGAPRAVVRARTASTRRSSAGSSCARTGRRSARCARTASCASTCRSTRRGTRVRACVHVEGGGARDRAPRPRSRADPRGDLLQAGPLLVADGAVAYDPDGRRRGLLAPPRTSSTPTSDRRPPPARGARPRRGRILAVAVRRALATRRRAHAASSSRG